MAIKIRNMYYLLAGALAVLFAATHAWNGQSAVLPTLMVNDIAQGSRIIFRYVWHMITAENLVFGIVFIILSFQSERAKTRSAAWTIATLLFVRLVVLLGITAFYDISAIPNTLIDSIAILIYAGFILLGIKVK